jgi:transcription initiation factor TFIIF subunit alpha
MFINRKPLASSSKTATATSKTGSPGPSGLRPLGKQPPPRPKSVPKTEEPEPVKQDEPGTYTDFKIFSHDLDGLKFNGFRFNTDKKVSLTQMPKPIKLNRKDPINKVEEFIGTVQPMIGADGQPVIGPDGQMVMVDANGRPALQHARNKEASTSGPLDKGKRKPFQKKTRQVFTIPEAQRQLKKEERFPWVLEDNTKRETWVGQLEDLGRADTHGFLMTMPPNGVVTSDHFIFIPSHRWYKMTKRMNLNSQNLEEAEEKVRIIFVSRIILTRLVV